MTNDISNESGTDEVDLSQLLRGQIGLVLTEGQVATLVERHGLTPPIGSWQSKPHPTNDRDEEELAEIGVLENGAPTEWFLALWRTITAPVFLVTVDRLVSGEVAEWLYLIDRMTFAEQIKSADGWTWLFGIHHELLPRVLLNIGLLRFTRNVDEVTLDPFPASEAWTSAVTFVETAPSGDPRFRSTRVSYNGHDWTVMADDGPDRVVSPLEVGEAVTITIGVNASESPIS